MLAALVGLVIGGAVGGGAIYAVWKIYYTQVTQNPDLAIGGAVVIGGTLTVLGGYMGMLLAVKAQKASKSKSRGQTGHKFVPRNKRK
jgi:uncharacterized protein (DUF1501 family)